MPEPAPEKSKNPPHPKKQRHSTLTSPAVPQRSEEEDDEWDFVFTYTRAQALQDGVLLDVSERARQAGFRLPVAVTAALWQDVAAIPPSYQGIQDVQGRLWDLLWMARLGHQGSNEERFGSPVPAHPARGRHHRLQRQARGGARRRRRARPHP